MIKQPKRGLDFERVTDPLEHTKQLQPYEGEQTRFTSWEGVPPSNCERAHGGSRAPNLAAPRRAAP
jgi:hypothetical protein